MNLLSVEILSKIKEILIEVEGNSEVRCIVFRSSGEKAFSAGFELGEQAFNSNTIQQIVQPFEDLLLVMNTYPKPIISLVQGYAFGGGCILSSASDITIATENALFSLPELGLGTGVLLQPVIDSIGRRKAVELLLTRSKIDAVSALKYGLINDVVKDMHALDNYLDNLTSVIAGNAPQATKEFLPAVRYASTLDYESSIRYLNNKIAHLMCEDEFRQGVESFKKKQPPPWQPIISDLNFK
jgi:enoyl-CoA hydratase